MTDCPDCGTYIGEAIKCRCGWKAVNAVSHEPLRIAGRSGFCDNTVCREIREAYRASQAFKGDLSGAQPDAGD